MPDGTRLTESNQMRTQLHDAADIPGDHGRRAAVEDVLRFAFPQSQGNLRLFQVVSSR